MTKVLNIKNVQIGAGRPKIIVPIVGDTHESVVSQAQSLVDRRIDMIEWRADYFRPCGLAAWQPMDTACIESVLATLSALRGILPGKPLIFTCRTKQEGGGLDAGPQDYAALNLAVARSGWADLVDIEVFFLGAATRQLIAAIQAAGALAVGSYHNFAATPTAEEILSRLLAMGELGADMVKMAVMPNDTGDVLTLLNATAAAYAQLDCPLITVSMSDIGRLSRIAGGICGSAATFGLVGQGSAPGQIAVGDLAYMLDVLHE